MIYRDLGKTKLKVSAIGLGTWNLGNQWKKMTDREAEDIINEAYQHGITIFDTAENYGIPDGTSERRLGLALKDIRKSVTIVSKIGYWGYQTGQQVPKNTSDMIRLCGHAILGRLKTDYVDVILCHEGEIMDPSVYISGFEALQKEGCIRHYGISTDSLFVLKQFNELSKGKCSVVELDYSLLNKNPEGAVFDYCMENNIGVLCRRPMASGILSGKYNRDSIFKDEIRKNWNFGEPQRDQYEKMMDRLECIEAVVPKGLCLSEIAMRYIISHETSPVALPGATSIMQVKENAKAGEKLLCLELFEKLKKI